MSECLNNSLRLTHSRAVRAPAYLNQAQPAVPIVTSLEFGTHIHIHRKLKSFTHPHQNIHENTDAQNMKVVADYISSNSFFLSVRTPRKAAHPPETSPAIAMSDDVPDYNTRLAFGTDQGRWLAQQVGESGRPHRRTASGGHVFHDLDSISPDPAQMASQQNPLAVDGKLQRVVTRCVETVPGLRIKTFRLAAGACAVCMILLFLLRFV